MSRKNSHIVYYMRGFFIMLTPKWLLKLKERQILKAYRKRADKQEIDDRVNYYNQLEHVVELPDSHSSNLSDHTYKKRKGNSVYFFDTFEFTRYFSNKLRWIHQPGDVTRLFDYPTVVKTRPLQTKEIEYGKKFSNSIIMNLDKVRHFLFVKDCTAFADKQSIVLFRGEVHGKPARIAFLDKFMGKEGFDVGDVSRKMEPRYQARRLSIDEHLRYRYIMSLQGNDVASNLKWVMSSNSIAVMPRPTCESWFMEGRLIPNYHYIEIKPDYSDLEERINYYNCHTEEAQAIVEHAHEYVRQFMDKEREEIIAYMVMRKYFAKTSVNGNTQLE